MAKRLSWGSLFAVGSLWSVRFRILKLHGRPDECHSSKARPTPRGAQRRGAISPRGLTPTSCARSPL